MSILPTYSVTRWVEINEILAQEGFGEALGGDLQMIAPTLPARDAADFIIEFRHDHGITHTQYAGA
jgi:hypothetical protein